MDAETREADVVARDGDEALPPAPSLREGERSKNWWMLAAVGGLVVLFLAVSVQKIWAGDFWGQLYTGQLILERGKLPHADEYTFTSTGHPIVEVRWLYCVLLALGWKIGPWVLCVGMAAVLGLMWGVIVWPLRRAAAAAPYLVMVAMVAGLGRWVLRPELVTDLFIAVFLTGLEAARRRGRAGWAWWLFAVQVLWVNMHSVPIFGPVLAWLFAGSAVVEGIWRKEQRRFAAWMVVLACAVTGASWVNPYLHQGAMVPVEMWREAGGVAGEVLGEMKSPLRIPLEFWGWDLWATVLMAVMVLWTCVLNRKQMGLARLGVVVMALYLGATAQRSASLLAIMGLWAALANISDLIGVSAARVALRGASRKAMLTGVTIVSLASAWYVASDAAWERAGVGRETGIGVVKWDAPRGAADFVVTSGADTRVFNKMRDGHYLEWRSGGRIKVFIDGRTDVFSDAFLREDSSIGPANWDAIADKYAINTAVLTVKGYEDLIRYLMKNKAWALVFLDHRNVVFVRDRAEQAALIAARRIDPSNVWSGAEPVDGIDSWKRAIGARPRPWETFGLAQSFLSIGSAGNAETYLRKTLELWPGHERAIAELAALCWFSGRVAEGDALEARLEARSEWSQYSFRSLAGMLTDAGRREEAAGAMQRALDAGSTDPQLSVALGDWHFEHKAWAAAKTDYESAVGWGADRAAEWKKLGYAREQTGDLKGAEEAYHLSLTKDGKQHEVWYLMGLVQARGGDRGAARSSLQKALQINPGFGAAQKALEGLK